MLGVVFKGGRRIALERFPDPRPGPRQVVVEIKASGMCGSDLHPYRKAAGDSDKIIGGGTIGIVAHRARRRRGRSSRRR